MTLACRRDKTPRPRPGAAPCRAGGPEPGDAAPGTAAPPPAAPRNGGGRGERRGPALRRLLPALPRLGHGSRGCPAAPSAAAQRAARRCLPPGSHRPGQARRHNMAAGGQRREWHRLTAGGGARGGGGGAGPEGSASPAPRQTRPVVFAVKKW